DVHFVDSNYVVAPGTVTTKSGTPCQVFGAYRRGWERVAPPPPLAAPAGLVWRGARGVGLAVLTKVAGSERPAFFGDLPDEVASQTWPAGEWSAQERLADFGTRVGAYAQLRDVPGADATSRLSPFLRFGAIHPRQVIAALSTTSGDERRFETEICWRDFYADVLFHHPESVSRALQPSMERLRVDRDAPAVERFHTWARGETGYPLVDAGMRQLLNEGWMHNRARMVAASFLVKHLHLDWRWGAKWFMWRLIDGDVASNQHGWQWTAGTGTDAAPFHRVFNPTLQAQRFDPEGVYIRRHIAELASVGAPQCLSPGARGGFLSPESYPAAMLDLDRERLEALSRFAAARSR
ncbi:MAG: cryptochrome/photolyase family protein, partial [Acidimicrobiales bacterium]